MRRNVNLVDLIRSRKMLHNASLLAIVAVDTEENEPIKNEVWWVRRHFLCLALGSGHVTVAPGKQVSLLAFFSTE